MRIKRYTIIDVYYNEDERKFSDKKRKELEKAGYELNQEDVGTPFDYCDQYIKYFVERKKKGDIEPHGCVYYDNGKKIVCKICGESIGKWLSKEIKQNKKRKT